MNITLYVPKELEESLRRRAAADGLTPSLFIQSLLRRELEAPARRFSERFAALAGSWEDRRDAEEIIDDIERDRARASRAPLK